VHIYKSYSYILYAILNNILYILIEHETNESLFSCKKKVASGPVLFARRWGGSLHLHSRGSEFSSPAGVSFLDRHRSCQRRKADQAGAHDATADLRCLRPASWRGRRILTSSSLARGRTEFPGWVAVSIVKADPAKRVRRISRRLTRPCLAAS
jgi:hypothetical protein